MKKKLKIALFDQKNNAGGGERFTKKILENIVDYTDEYSIDYYGFSNLGNIKKSNKKKNKINFFPLNSLKLRSKGFFKIGKSNKLISTLQDRLKNYTTHLPSFISGDLKKEMEEKLNKYDVVLFLWPYFINFPKIKARKIIILHDFNFKYYFSGQSTFNKNRIKNLNKSMKIWIDNSDVIVTSNFMKKELFKFYPNFKNRVRIIRMGSLASTNTKKKKNFNFLKKPFILCPASTLGHKNISSLIKAFDIIRKKNNNINLVFTGPGTEILNGINVRNYLEITDNYNNFQNIFGLGYIEDEDINHLIKKAKVVVNCSLYEPGNGSGGDAWKIGTPVAMSNIPSFKEQLSFLDVKAELFDPANPKSIAKKVNNILLMNKFKKNKNINHSKKMMKKVSWNLIIKDYIKFLDIK